MRIWRRIKFAICHSLFATKNYINRALQLHLFFCNFANYSLPQKCKFTISVGRLKM